MSITFNIQPVHQFIYQNQRYELYLFKEIGAGQIKDFAPVQAVYSAEKNPLFKFLTNGRPKGGNLKRLNLKKLDPHARPDWLQGESVLGFIKTLNLMYENAGKPMSDNAKSLMSQYINEEGGITQAERDFVANGFKKPIAKEQVGAKMPKSGLIARYKDKVEIHAIEGQRIAVQCDYDRKKNEFQTVKVMVPISDKGFVDKVLLWMNSRNLDAIDGSDVAWVVLLVLQAMAGTLVGQIQEDLRDTFAFRVQEMQEAFVNGKSDVKVFI